MEEFSTQEYNKLDTIKGMGARVHIVLNIPIGRKAAQLLKVIY